MCLSRALLHNHPLSDTQVYSNAAVVETLSCCPYVVLEAISGLEIVTWLYLFTTVLRALPTTLAEHLSVDS